MADENSVPSRRLISFDADGNLITDPSGAPAGNVVVSNKGVLVPTDMDNSLNRDHTAVATTLTTNTWTSGENVRQITIVARNAANPKTDYTSASYSDQRPDATWLAVTFNAANDTDANTWLSQVNADATASKLYLVQVGVPRTFTFSAPLTRIDYKRAIGVMTVNVVIEAIAG